MDDINDLIESFLDYLKFERFLPNNTISSYKSDLKLYTCFISEKNIKTFEDVTHEDILNFLEGLFKNHKETSVSRVLSTLRSFYKYLIRIDQIKNNPLKDIKNPRHTDKLIKIMSQDEVSLFLDKIPSSTSLQLRNRAMFEMLYSSGLRVSEIVNLKLTDIDLEQNLIRFIGKGNKERMVPLGKKARMHTIKYLQHGRHNIEREKKSDFVFLNKNGNRITRQGFWKVLKQYILKFDMDKNIHPHIFRHSFATHMLEEGADLRIVQELLGHSSISTTEIYTNLDKKHIKNTYFKYHPSHKKNAK
ncbi:MAG: site-specific tyrosine recombinase XerD [Actinobacteria bacterium]|nr:site-specific tyrosine recombinase XerD [Actinomycetota bacterium]